MRLIPMTATLCCAILATAAAPAHAGGDRASRKQAAIDAAVPAGKPESCIPITQIRESRVLSDNIIDFHMNNGKVYRNTLPNSCPQLGFEEAFRYETSLSQLCSTDIITVLIQGSGVHRGASCGLGQFQPVTGVPK